MGAPPPLDITVIGGTDVGTVRDHNEDSMLAGDLDLREQVAVLEPWRNERAERGPLLVVCDGMGGVQGGEVASQLAAAVLWREMKATPSTRDPEVFARLLRRAARIANHDVYAMSRRDSGLRGMGTTLCAAAVCGDRLVIATVGDSRAYVLRGGQLVQVTRDQSLSQALLAAGHSEGEAASAGGAILQALGVGPDIEPSLSLIDVRRGDRVLLCSDGLHGLVTDPALAVLLSAPADVGDSVRLLIAAARVAGGTDNITALVAELNGDRLEAPRDDTDLPCFREFDPQQEGDPALTQTSYVARRLAARIGLPTGENPPILPTTGQHAVMKSKLRVRVPPTSVPMPPDVPGPAANRVAPQGGAPRLAWLPWAVLAVVACILAWWLGAR